MKNKKTFLYCEYCNKAWEDVSPLKKEQYDGGFVRLGDYSYVTLNSKKPNYTFVLSGIYCNYRCLTEYIKKVRKEK